MRTKLIAGCGILFLATLTVGWSFTGDEEVGVALEDVPAAVLNAVRAKFPDAQLIEAERETEEGRTIYEIEINNDGKRLDIEVSRAGDILGIEAGESEADDTAQVNDR